MKRNICSPNISTDEKVLFDGKLKESLSMIKSLYESKNILNTKIKENEILNHKYIIEIKQLNEENIQLREKINLLESLFNSSIYEIDYNQNINDNLKFN